MNGEDTSLLWELFKHLRSWLANLNRAGEARQQQSIKALREVVAAARKTHVYLRSIRDTGNPDHKIEANLTVLWTNLGFTLKDLGIEKLAKRCQISGKQWSNPKHYDSDFILKADISLERMEKIALEILNQINNDI